MTALEIAKKYVYGNHDALTDRQEVIDMVKDIEAFIESKKDTYGVNTPTSKQSENQEQRFFEPK